MNIYPNQIKHCGFTLVEVLVTMVILSIGFLGLVGLQATTLRDNNSAIFRTQAVLYANDMAERMRANPNAVTDNDFLNVTLAASTCNNLPNPYCGAHRNASSSNNQAVPGVRCNSTDLAAFDLNTWFCGSARDNGNAGNRGEGVNTQLSQASASIVCSDNNTTDTDTCSPDSPHTITVSWRTLRAKDTNFNDDVDNDGTNDCLNPGDAATNCQSVSLVIRP